MDELRSYEYEKDLFEHIYADVLHTVLLSSEMTSVDLWSICFKQLDFQPPEYKKVHCKEFTRPLCNLLDWPFI